jgi:hypothetical protein
MCFLDRYTGIEISRITTPFRLGLGLFFCGAGPLVALFQLSLPAML